MRFRILVFDGVDELDFLGPFEVLRRAASFGCPFNVALVTLEPCTDVKGACGLRFFPDGTLKTELEDRPDVLIVPGGGWVSRAPHGIRAEIEHGRLTGALQTLHGAGVTLAAVCTGSMALAAAGLLDGRPAIAHHDAIADLRRTAAQVLERRIVDDGDIITSGGVTSSIDLGLHLVERFASAEVAAKIAGDLEYNRNA
jgi:transcriptional regulator GlxA family with amidase domain